MHVAFNGGSRKKYYLWEGTGPSSFGRQQRLGEIIIAPIKNWGGVGQDLGACAPPALA